MVKCVQTERSFSYTAFDVVFKVVLLLTPVKQICWMQTDVNSRFPLIQFTR
jgi:hypothetical protein